jgi:hypothetical protein
VPEWHVKCLYDVTFDFEEYKALGDNDGTLRMIARTLEMIGYDKLSPRAWAAMYTNNY